MGNSNSNVENFSSLPEDKLITDRNLINLNHINYVYGPLSLTLQVSQRYGKTIYIFGETHGVNHECRLAGADVSNSLPIEEFLWQTILQSRKFIDLYVEEKLPTSPLGYSFKYQEELLSDNHGLRLRNITKKFIGCAGVVNREQSKKAEGLGFQNPSICRKMRYHFIENTMFETDTEQFSTSYKWKEQIIFLKVLLIVEHIRKIPNWNTEEFWSVIVPEVVDLIFQALDYIRIHSAEEIVSEMIKDRKVAKQLNNLRDNNLFEVRQTLIDWAIESIELYRHAVFNDSSIYSTAYHVRVTRTRVLNLETLYDFFETQKTMGIDSTSIWWRNEDMWKLLYELTIAPRTILMDLYAFARFFKSFDVKSNYPEMWRQPRKADNIIIYAGDSHSLNYRHLLSRLGFETIGSNFDTIYDLDSARIESEFPEEIIRRYGNPDASCVSLADFKKPFFSSRITDPPSKNYPIYTSPEEPEPERLFEFPPLVPEPEPERLFEFAPLVPETGSVLTAESFDGWSYRELQRECKKRKKKAVGKREDLIERLLA